MGVTKLGTYYLFHLNKENKEIELIIYFLLVLSPTLCFDH